ncbi:MAG: hypothetical protein PUB89_01130 [Oscillospiraceae bacterium]|nr:hypothetical protein [Oscillospiraceae bacterium]
MSIIDENRNQPFEIFEKDNKPKRTIFEKIDLLFTDVETEGKKQGYEKAASIYTLTFNQLKIQLELLESKLKELEIKHKSDVDYLKQKKKERDELKTQRDRLVTSVSYSTGVSVETINMRFASGCGIIGNSPTTCGFSILDIICDVKERKLRKAIAKGYAEAKEIFESKIKAEQEKLENLSNEYDIKSKKYENWKQKSEPTINEIQLEINKLLIEIAELSIIEKR